MSTPSVITSAIWPAAVAIVTGGAAGWLSSVYAAGPVARRQETARRRMDAQQQLRVAVSAYLGRLQIVQDERTMYPESYADLAGREQLAISVLRLLPPLNPASQERITAALHALVGTETLKHATQRADVPADALPPDETERKRHEVEERQIRMGYHDRMGCKGETWHRCEQEHYPQVRSEYGELAVLWLTRAHPHGIHNESEHQTCAALLTQILGETQPPGKEKPALP